MKVSKNLSKWVILVVTALLVILQQCDKNAISVAAVPISKEFGFSPAQMGLVISCFFISYAVMNIVGGYITDMFGTRKVVATVVTLWSIFTGITGAAWSFASLIVIRFLFGAAEGAFPPTNSTLVAELFPVEKRAFPKSFIGAASGLGGGVAALAIVLITNSLGWRKAFWIYCVIGFVLVAVFLLVSKQLKRDSGADGKAQRTSVPLKELLKMRLLWKIVPIQFAAGTFLWGLNSWMPSYWMNVKGLKLVAMGVAAAIPQFVSPLVLLCMGFLLDKYLMGKEKWVMTICAVIAGISVYLTYTAPSVTIGVTFMTLSMVAVGNMVGANLICVIKYFPRNAIGSGAGIVNFGNQLAGSIAPAIMGFIITAANGSYAAVFGFVIGMMAIAFCIALTVNTKELAAKVREKSVLANTPVGGTSTGT